MSKTHRLVRRRRLSEMEEELAGAGAEWLNFAFMQETQNKREVREISASHVRFWEWAAVVWFQLLEHFRGVICYGCSYDHNDIYQVIYQDYALSFMYSANLCIKIKLFLIHLNSVHRWEEHKKQQEMKSTSGQHHVYLKPSVLTVFIALSPFAKGNTTGWRFRWDGQSARSLSWTSELTLGDSCSQPLTCFTLSSRINNTAVCAVFAGSSLSQLRCFVS